MVEETLDDGRRIAQLLAAELDGREDGRLDALAVVDADRSATGTDDGERAYDVAVGDAVLARVFLQHDRCYVTVRGPSDTGFEDAPERALEAAADEDLRARPRASDPPATLVFVENGAQVKGAVEALRAALAATDP